MASTLVDGRFLLGEKLGEGGMAQVYKAYDRRLQVWRAVKVLLPDFAKRKKLRQRFEAEAQAMALLEHRNIVRVYDVGSEGDQSWILMELCSGGSLEGWIETHGVMPPRRAAEVALEIVAGLQTAHANGVIHRDVKPQNVLISDDGVCKVTDFGIAQLDQGHMTRTGSVMGTLGYMAPEQRSDSKKVDARSDVYATGATLYNLLTGRISMDLFAAPAQEPELLDGVHEALLSVVVRSTAYRREDRFQDMTALADALRAALPELPPLPAGTPPLAPPAEERRRRVPPTLLERALAEAEEPDAPLPGETILPAAFRETLLSETGLVQEDPPEEKKVIPWVPATERGIAAEESFEHLYERPAPRPHRVDLGFEETPPPPPTPTPAPTPAPSRTLDEEPESHGPSDPTEGLVWGLRELAAFASQILKATLEFVAGPVRHLAWPAVAILLIMGASSFQGAKSVNGAEEAMLSSMRMLQASLERDAELVDELVAAGANEALLRSHLAAWEQAETEEEKDRAALELTAILQQELVQLDETDDPQVIRQRKSLSSRISAIGRNREAWVENRDEWARRTETATGGLAVRLGLASRPAPEP